MTTETHERTSLERDGAWIYATCSCGWEKSAETPEGAQERWEIHASQPLMAFTKTEREKILESLWIAHTKSNETIRQRMPDQAPGIISRNVEILMPIVGKLGGNMNATRFGAYNGQ